MRQSGGVQQTENHQHSHGYVQGEQYSAGGRLDPTWDPSGFPHKFRVALKWAHCGSQVGTGCVPYGSGWVPVLLLMCLGRVQGGFKVGSRWVSNGFWLVSRWVKGGIGVGSR